MPARRNLVGLLALCVAALAFARPATAQRFTHDANGRVIQETYLNGTTVLYGYDAWGNVISREVTDSPPDPGGGGGGGGGSGGFCGATAAYGSPHAPQLDTLRAFRERVLRPTRPGRALIELYERFSRHACAWLERSALLRGLARAILAPLVFALEHPLLLLLAAVLLGLRTPLRRLGSRAVERASLARAEALCETAWRGIRGNARGRFRGA